nr:hypothetical protein BaRGS_034507 [Batillaria attramentaria]
MDDDTFLDGERASEVTHNSHPPPATQDTPDKLDLSTATPVTATTTTTSTACISNINKNNNSGVPTITNAAASKPDIVTTESSNVRSDDRGESPPQTKDVPDTGDAEADQQKVQRSVSPGSRPDSRSEVKAGCVLCPLCQDECQGLSSLQSHLALSHKVTQEGMQRLLAMVDLPSVGAAADSADGSPDDHDAANGNGDSQTLAPSSASPTSAGTGVSAAEGFDEDVELDVERLEVEHQKLIVDDAVDGSVAGEKADPNEDQYRCQICTKTFINIDLLYAHQNELGHLELKQTPRGPGYLCWKKGCNQYFKTAQALQVHFREIHCKRSVLVGDEVIKQTFSCGQCTLVFRSEDALQKHHQYHLIKAITQCSVCQLIFHSVKRLRSHLSMAHNELKPAEQETLLKGLDANLALLKNSPGSETFLDTLLGGGLNPATNTTSSHPSAADSTRSTLPHITSEKNSQDKPVSKQKGVEVSSVVSKQEEMLDEAGLQGSAGDSQSDGSDKMELDEEAEQLEMLKKSFPDQQSLEDFINSQAMAEGNYEDPSRKFKCHRCKVGFTKQSYLTAHNKTLQHRRGDKVNYSVERYLDPSRPHKCDVCKESFTQKNILLVHYNSVSHLHKMKQATQQGMLPSSVASTSADPSPSPSPTQTSTTAASSSSTTTTTTTNGLTAESTDWRPYRCNVCKTAYSQSSNLENHLRSVSHQSRVLRINELVVDGQININQPLIEQPDMLSEAQSQQLQQMMVEAMQQQQQLSAVSSQSLIFQALPGLNSMPMFPGMLPSATTALFNPTTAALASFANAAALESELADQIRHHDKSAGSKNASADRGAEKVQNSALNLTSDSAEGQRSVKLEPDSFVKALTASIKKEIEENGARRAADSLENPPVSQKSEMATNTMEGLSLTRGSDQPSNPTLAASIPVTVGRPRGYMGRFKPQIHRNLLENIGFECVMQFNECTQSRRRDREKDKEKETDKEIEEENAAKEENPEPVVKEEKEEETETRMDMPEINKSRCLMCGIEFSSLFVLKAHEEEVHNSMVPIDVVEDFGEKFKEDLEKKIPKHEPEPVPVSTPQPVQTSQPATSTISTDKASTSKATNSEMPPPPPPPPQLPPPYDMSQMMPMLGMMHPMQVPMNLVSLGMQPSLMPMMHGASMDMAANFPLQLGMMDPSLVSAQQQIQQAATNAQNQKRVRTRISDEQLKILRAHFDINNSPSEAQINQMSEQSGLPQKVIKHWFRNTLFKERQRNKDSPYNFSNPPSTTIDLEEYEKTGKIPQVKIEPSDDDDEPMPPQRQEEGETDLKQEPPTTPVPSADPMPKLEPGEDRRENESRSNASTPSNMSSIPSTPTCSAPPTPTPTATPGSIVDTHVAALARENAAAAAAAAQSSMTKRANRTRFTDFQIKQLQDYFEQNAYPKDDELDHLSRLLNLSPRVIVVWFQNARQKARKIYENQPAAEAQKEGSSPFQRTPSLNYQCKKCGAVFQRYYELIKHQKRPCLSENNNNKPLPSFTDDDSISSGTSLDDSCLSDSFNSSNLSMPSHKDTTPPSMSAAFRCDKCSSSFNRIDLWQEHQKVHNVTTTLFPPYSSSSAFGMLQSLAQQEDNKATSSVTSSSPGSTPVKRKLEAEEDKLDDQPRDKRLRTTILPEQLDYLYQKYQVDCNPSRKQLESIAQEVGLKKRVVQVWFQNTRARERKGQYRAHQQLIHKRCPFCRALFRAKSALESHLATKHPEEMAKGEINVDAIPDATMESPQPAHSMPSTSSAAHTGSADISKILSPTSVQPYLSFMPPASLSLGFPPPVPTDPQLQLSMKQIYEDSYKKYISELSASTHPPKPSHVMETPSPARHVKPEKRAPPPATSTGNDEDAPLDLSIPIKPSPNKNNGSSSSTPAATTVSSSNNSSHMAQTTSSRSSFIEMANREFERHRQNSHNESFSETHSDLADSEYQSEIGSSPPSPRSSSGGMPHLQNKRYRTQMTSLQVKVMKTLFVDYKTPTMSECELLGREIGLPKRVVQVWFQNARAKEKKSKLTMAKTFGGDMDFPKTPEECNLCNFKYSHKFTVQDHIFTKRHIDNVKSYIQSQSDAEREISDPASVSGLLRQQQSREMEQARKMWDKSSPSTSQHLAQLQGLNAAAAFGLPGSMAASKSSKEQQHQQEQQQQQQQQSQQQAAELAQMMALGGYLPGLDPAYLSFMYSGLPGYFPGMGAMPLLQPALLPGAEHLMAYDPLSFGTPLPLLQIPSQAIKSVSDKLQDANCTLAQYTQDCKTLADLKGMVNALDATCITESPVDVGYICKKCQMVYPVREACLTHQRMVCYVGGGEGGKTMLKLEQVQFECRSSPHSSSRVSVPVDSSPAHTVSSKKSPVAATASSHDSSEKDRLGHREAKE